MKTRIILGIGVAVILGFALLMACYAIQTKIAVAASADGGERAGRIIRVHGDADLMQAVSAARPGDRILLAPGTYERLGLQGVKVAGGVTIASADLENRAVIAGVEMSDCSGLRFENLEITINNRTQMAFLVGHSDHISLDRLNVHDGVGGDRRGIVIRDSSDVSVTNSDLHDMGGGVGAIDSHHVVMRGNRFHDLRGDGAGGVGSSNITITGNHFTDFYPAPGDHPDAIQFFTYGTKAPVHDLTITDNTVVRGKGGPVQGVFLGNEIDMPYQQVTITGNTLIGTMFNGIAVGVGEHVLIANNVVQAYADMDSWIIIERNTDAKVTNNQASSFIFKGVNKGLAETGNRKLKAAKLGDVSALKPRASE